MSFLGLSRLSAAGLMAMAGSLSGGCLAGKAGSTAGASGGAAAGRDRRLAVKSSALLGGRICTSCRPVLGATRALPRSRAGSRCGGACLWPRGK